MKNENIIILPLDINFINYLSDYLINNFSLQDFDKICLVFAGKRPSLFLKKQMFEKLKTSFFAPNCFSTDEFIRYIVSKKERRKILSELDCIYLLYDIIKSEIPEFYKKYKSFTEFLSWGKEIFTFIEELFLEKIEEKSLNNIKNLAEIGFDVPESVNKLLVEINNVKNIFYKKLEEKKCSTRGIFYYLASEISKDIKFDEFKEIIFCTPFYLHKTEIEIIKNIFKNNKAKIFLQTDNKEWKSYKRLAKEFNLNIELEDKNYQISKPNINFYSSYDIHSQICAVREVLKNIDLDEKTVIVLPQAELAIPLISEISYLVKNFNLACGYPIYNSSIINLLKNIFDAQLTKKDNNYYTKDYLKVLNNNLIKNINLLNHPSEISHIVITKINDLLLGKIEDEELNGCVFINLKNIEKSKLLNDKIFESLKSNGILKYKEDIIKIISSLHEILFFSWEGISNFKSLAKNLKILLDLLIRNEFFEKYPLNFKIIEELYKICEDIENCLFAEVNFDKEEIFKIFLDILKDKKIPILGSPLKGLQILGFYETRNLSFDNVIILDLNEGVIPDVKLNFPLIPKEVISFIGIDRVLFEEEIQYYHFERLIYSSKNVHLFFIESEEKERSRFLEKILWEKQKETRQLDSINIVENYFETEVLQGKDSIKKTKYILDYLKNFQYSVSSLDTYIRCPLKFYFKYVLRLKETEDVFEEPESKDIGNFLHELLKESFEKFVGKEEFNIEEDFKKEFLNLFSKKFEQKLEKRYKTESFLIKKIMEFHLKNFLEFESKRRENIKRILFLEKEFIKKINLGNTEIMFKCKIDRVDELKDNSLLVIDYKTGGFETMLKNLEIEETSLDREIIKKKIRSFQLPLYQFVVESLYPNFNVNSGFYDIREKNEPIKLLFKKDETEENKNKKKGMYLKCLNFVINEILNSEINFTADDTDENYCKNCDFKYLCR
ncbi:MAG: PD-(D/E)XK nuclease family protein [Endomicrobiia bacterium]